MKKKGIHEQQRQKRKKNYHEYTHRCCCCICQTAMFLFATKNIEAYKHEMREEEMHNMKLNCANRKRSSDEENIRKN